MKYKHFRDLKNLIYFLIVILLFHSCDFAKANKEYLRNFDLKLTGRVLELKQNDYGQILVCLEVIESNYQEYFPIHNPNKYSKGDSNSFENRFFIKVNNDKAVFIFNPEPNYSKITKHIIKEAIIKINEDEKKSFRVYNKLNNHNYGGLRITTYPIRNNIEISCLNNID